MTANQITLPAIAAIRAGLGAVVGAESAYELRVATAADAAEDRTAHVVKQRQPVLVRKDGAKWRGKRHQIATCGISQSSMPFAHDFALFKATGLIAPADISDTRIVTDKYWRPATAMANALLREFCRMAASGNTPVFTPLQLCRKPSPELAADLAAAAALDSRGVAAAKADVTDDVTQQLVSDFAVFGAMLVPCEGALRGKSAAFRVNEAWRDALTAAGRINGALPVEAPSEAASEPSA